MSEIIFGQPFFNRMKMKRKVILVVVAILCLLGSGYAQKTEKMKVREWQSPVLKSARTCLEVQVQGYEPGMKKEGIFVMGWISAR